MSWDDARARAALRQMFDAYAATEDEGRRAQLEKNIRRQWADLVGLTGGMQ